MMRLCVKTNEIIVILFLSLLTFAFLAGSAFTEDTDKIKKNATLDEVLQTIKQHPTLPHGSFRTWPAAKNMGGDDAGPGEPNAYFGDAPRDLGFDQRGTVPPGPAVGLTMGYTTYDYQHNCRTTRQVAWRGSPDIHFAWMKKHATVPIIGAGFRLTAYNMFDAEISGLKWPSSGEYFGGDDLHSNLQRSGYCGLDVMSDGRGLVYNSYDPDGLSPYNYYPVIWPDQSPGMGVWGYAQGAPEDTREPDWAQGGGNWLWPYATFQLYDNGGGQDTIIHIVASESGSISNLVHRYFRRTGGPHPYSPANSWTSMTFDSGMCASTIVEAAPPDVDGGYEGKVAVVWTAYFGSGYPGDGESGHLEPISLALEQNAQDVYMMTSDNAGLSWNSKYNVTKNDITSMSLNWWPLGDISAVIDTWGRLHIVWAARPHRNLTGEHGTVTDPQMYYPMYPLGSRILHWSDEGEAFGDLSEYNYITIVKDAMHDFSEMDSICIGGAWHGMALNLPQIGQCDDKLYVTFAQYQDVANGVWDNCHISNWTRNEYIGSANANLYFSVSPMANGGLNWDPARLLTDFTPRCDTGHTYDPYDPVDPEALSVCHSHFYNSMSRWGMNIDPATGVGGNFINATVVSPFENPWDYTSEGYYLDVFYVDDLWPGGLVQGEGMWTINPVKWFRFPCVDAVEDPILVIEPAAIYASTPSWSKPGFVPETNVTLKNIGNSELTISNIEIEVEDEYYDPYDPSNNVWLSYDLRGFDGSITAVVPDNTYDIGVITNSDNNVILYGQVIIYGLPDGVGDITETSVLKGRLVFHWDNGRESYLPIEWIIADTVQTYEQDTLYTRTIGITVANNGNYGGGLYDTCGRMDFHVPGYTGKECDTCGQGPGNAEWKYLAEGAPFVVRDIGGEARISTSVSGHSPFSEAPDKDPESRDGSDTQFKDGFRPQEGQPEEHTNAPFCTWIESGLFVTADSAIALKNQLIAPIPQSGTDTSDFFVLITKFWNNTDAEISDMFVGTIEDWDIPSDSSTRNTSGVDADRKLMYMTGWEALQSDTLWCDTLPGAYNQNTCTDSDMRFGGSAFFGGVFKAVKHDTIYFYDEFHQKHIDTVIDIIKNVAKYEEAQGSFTFKRTNWMGQDVRDHIPAQRLYDTLSSLFFGYSPWACSDPEGCFLAESIYQDLGMITSYGSATLGVTSLGLPDTLTFVKFLASEYDGGLEGLQETIDEAKAFTLDYLCCDIWGIPGDANTDGKINILDIVHIINFKYKQDEYPDTTKDNGKKGVLWPSAYYAPDGWWWNPNAGPGYPPKTIGWVAMYPTDNCDNIMDCDGLLGINILDIVYLINYRYKDGPAPYCTISFYE